MIQIKQRYKECTHNLCWLATEKLLKNKWRRNDVKTFVEEWTGYSRYELYEDERAHGQISFALKYKILEELAMAGEDMVDGIMHGIDPEFNPVSLRPRREPASGKVRNVAYLDMRHQQLGHIVKLGLEDHLRARILPTQHASIPGHGQTGLTRQIKRMLNRKLGIRYYQKTDCDSAYASTTYSAVIKLLRAEIPRAQWILACMEVMARYAPGGHLIIGGYLDAWLFNYVMSYAMRYMLSLRKSRRENQIPMVIRAVTYMDDMWLGGSAKSGLIRAVKLLTEWLWATFHIRLRTTTGVIRLASITEEKDRKKSTSKASRHAAMIDMGGYRISRTHVTMRKRNAKKAIRCFRRAQAELDRTGTLKRQRACSLIALNGLVQNSDSFQLCQKYNVFGILRVAKRVQKYWAKEARKKRKEYVEYVTDKHRKQYQAICGADGATA